MLVTSSSGGQARSVPFIALSFASTCFSFVVNIIGMKVILRQATHAASQVSKRLSHATAARRQSHRSFQSETCGAVNVRA
jgi:hypothetical protein